MARLSSFRRFHGNAKDLAARRLNRGTKRTKLSVFFARARTRALFAASRRPSGRRPLDLTIVKMKHKSYAFLIRVCLTLPRFSFSASRASTFRPIVLFSTFDQDSVSSPSEMLKNRPSSTNFTLNAFLRDSLISNEQG